MGVKGVSIATTITYVSTLLIITLYLSLKKGFVPPESWHFFNFDSIKNLYEFLKISIFSALMLI